MEAERVGQYVGVSMVPGLRAKPPRGAQAVLLPPLGSLPSLKKGGWGGFSEQERLSNPPNPP